MSLDWQKNVPWDPARIRSAIEDGDADALIKYLGNLRRYLTESWTAIATAINYPQGSNYFITPEGGLAIPMTNKLGYASIKGEIVEQSYTYDKSIQISHSNEDHPIGVVYNSGIPDGEIVYVVISGIADVLFKDTVAPSTQMIHVYQSNVSGRADGSIGSVNTARHWGEIGHCLESKSAGTDVLAKCVLHFN